MTVETTIARKALLGSSANTRGLIDSEGGGDKPLSGWGCSDGAGSERGGSVDSPKEEDYNPS